MLWGLVVFSIHLLWLAPLFFESGFIGYAFLSFLSIVLWLSFFSGLWFWTQSFLYQLFIRCFTKNSWCFFFSWFVATFLFFSFIQYGALFPCGLWEGYSFFNPLLFFVHYSCFWFLLRCFGYNGGLIFLIFLQSFLFFIFLKIKNRWYYFFLFFFTFFLIESVFYRERKKISSDISLVFIWPYWSFSHNPAYCVYRMISEITRQQFLHQEKKYFLLPESSFCYDMYSYTEFLTQMSDFSKDSIVFLGGQRKTETDGVKNSFFAIKDGKISFFYDKKHLMPFIERDCLLTKIVGNILNDKKSFFSYGDIYQSDQIILDGIIFQLFICSELFFVAKEINGNPILFLYNDLWFRYDFVKQWIFLFIEYISLCYDVPILWGSTSGRTNIK
ncbi:hypothetical protein HYV11_00840 [Candidatus Dependentiae bacterium]|nr:hypothetical protein [Candidatus Dependentiae bacterium]